MVIRWPGVIKPGTVKDQLFAALDWVPTLVDIAGGRELISDAKLSCGLS